MSCGQPHGDSRIGLGAVGVSRSRSAPSRKPRRPRVLIAAAPGAISRGLKIALEAAGFTVSGEYASARAAIESALRTRPDVCLVDVRIPGGSTTVLEQVADELPATRIVLLTDPNEETDLLAALKAGAAGSLPKDIEPRRLPIALRAILAGEAAVPRDQVYRLIEELRRQRQSGRSLSASGQEVNLTRRELEVLEHLAKERTTADIAEHLGTSPGTVRSHIHALRQKLGVEPRTVAADVLSSQSLRESTLLTDLATRRRGSATARGSKLSSGTLSGP